MRMLVSVKTVDEALLAASNGADFIDLKEPAQGALGGLPVATIRAIVAALREAGITLPVSATIGDFEAHELPAILAQVDAVGGCGVDYVKVGITRGRSDNRSAPALLSALAASRWALVPVFIGDDDIDPQALAQACALRFPAVMVDTADKRRGSLFDALPVATLRSFVDSVRAAGSLVGLAGALRLPDLPRLAGLAPDFAGFRSAVCVGDRAGALDVARLQALAAALHGSSDAAETVRAPIVPRAAASEPAPVHHD